MLRSTRLLASGLVGLLACAGETPRASGTGAVAAHSSAPSSTLPQVDTLPGGVIRVTNRSPVDSGKWSLVFERTVQPPDDDPGELRTPTSLALLDDGSLIVADEDPAQIRRYDRQGRYAGAIGRDGEGPGEYRSTLLAVRGDTLVVHDPSLARTSTFALSTGRLIAIHRSTPRLLAPIGVDASGRIVLPHPVAANWEPESSREKAYVRVALDGSRTDTIFLPRRSYRNQMKVIPSGGRVRVFLNVPLQPELLSIPDPAGGVLHGWSARAEWVASQNGPDTTIVFSRPTDERPVSRAEKKTIIARLVRKFAEYATEHPNSPIRATESALRAAITPSEIPDTLPNFDQIAVDRRGRRWIRRFELDSATLRFDLFDRDGRWLDVVSIPADRWIPRERAMSDPYTREPAWASDHVAVPIADADGAMAIQIYRIVRRQ